MKRKTNNVADPPVPTLYYRHLISVMNQLRAVQGDFMRLADLAGSEIDDGDEAEMAFDDLMRKLALFAYDLQLANLSDEDYRRQSLRFGCVNSGEGRFK